MLNWFINDKKITENKQKKKSKYEKASYYVIKPKPCDTSTTDDRTIQRRLSTIEPMEETLIDYDSEYQYLFSIIDDFEECKSMEDHYVIGNVARHFLEIFMKFKMPHSRKSLRAMITDYSDDKEIEDSSCFLKLLNNESHTDFSSLFQHQDKGEIGTIIEKMKKWIESC